MTYDEVIRPRRQRADAVRNRAKILEVTTRLFAEHGVDGVSMDQIATEAGVGKGTLFRRFGDKAGLGVALLADRERDIQRAVTHGPPPLGPGAPAEDRLRAFLVRYSEFLDANLSLVHMSETACPGARYRIGAYMGWHRHVRDLLAEANPALDADYVAHLLLAGLAADLRKALTDQYSSDRATRAIAAVVDLVAKPAQAPVPPPQLPRPMSYPSHAPPPVP